MTRPKPVQGADGKFIRTLQGAERDAEACRLKSRSLSYRQIAVQLGFSDHTNARRAVERALAATVVEPAAELRQIELMKLDALEQAALAVLERQHVTVSKGEVVRHDGELLIDDGPVLQAIDRLVKIQDRRAKLVGLDAPQRLEVITIDAIDAEIARLTAELEQRLTAELDGLDAGQTGTPPAAPPAQG